MFVEKKNKNKKKPRRTDPRLPVLAGARRALQPARQGPDGECEPRELATGVGVRRRQRDRGALRGRQRAEAAGVQRHAQRVVGKARRVERRGRLRVQRPGAPKHRDELEARGGARGVERVALRARQLVATAAARGLEAELGAEAAGEAVRRAARARRRLEGREHEPPALAGLAQAERLAAVADAGDVRGPVARPARDPALARRAVRGLRRGARRRLAVRRVGRRRAGEAGAGVAAAAGGAGAARGGAAAAPAAAAGGAAAAARAAAAAAAQRHARRRRAREHVGDVREVHRQASDTRRSGAAKGGAEVVESLDYFALGHSARPQCRDAMPRAR